MFALPISRLSSSWPDKSKIWAYNIDQRNTWPGPWNNLAAHVYDIALLFGHYTDQLPTDGDRAIAREMTEAWICFANGQSPWEPAGQENNAIVWGPDGQVGRVLPEKERAKSRRLDHWKIISELGHDKASDALGVFFATA